MTKIMTASDAFAEWNALCERASAVEAVKCYMTFSEFKKFVKRCGAKFSISTGVSPISEIKVDDEGNPANRVYPEWSMAYMSVTKPALLTWIERGEEFADRKGKPLYVPLSIGCRVVFIG